MPDIKELRIVNPGNIYKEIASALYPYREKAQGSMHFIVEGSQRKPIVCIKYPGKKLKKRILKTPNKKSALWANLYDFEVVPSDKRFKTGYGFRKTLITG